MVKYFRGRIKNQNLFFFSFQVKRTVSDSITVEIGKFPTQKKKSNFLKTIFPECDVFYNYWFQEKLYSRQKKYIRSCTAFCRDFNIPASFSVSPSIVKFLYFGLRGWERRGGGVVGFCDAKQTKSKFAGCRRQKRLGNRMIIVCFLGKYLFSDARTLGTLKSMKRSLDSG